MDRCREWQPEGHRPDGQKGGSGAGSKHDTACEATRTGSRHLHHAGLSGRNGKQILKRPSGICSCRILIITPSQLPIRSRGTELYAEVEPHFSMRLTGQPPATGSRILPEPIPGNSMTMQCAMWSTRWRPAEQKVSALSNIGSRPRLQKA